MEPPVEPVEGLGAHPRCVGVPDLRVQAAAEPIARPQRPVNPSDDAFQDSDPVGRRTGVELSGQSQERPGGDQSEYAFNVEMLQQAVYEVIDAVLAEAAV